MNTVAVRGRDINPNDKINVLSLELSIVLKIINKTSNTEEIKYIFKLCIFFFQFTILKDICFIKQLLLPLSREAFLDLVNWSWDMVHQWTPSLTECIDKILFAENDHTP